MNEQMDIFDLLYKPIKIKNKIRTIELFGGYGSQLLAMKYLGADVEQFTNSQVNTDRMCKTSRFKR